MMSTDTKAPAKEKTKAATDQAPVADSAKKPVKSTSVSAVLPSRRVWPD